MVYPQYFDVDNWVQLFFRVNPCREHGGEQSSWVLILDSCMYESSRS